jgi:hypothetical protein
MSRFPIFHSTGRRVVAAGLAAVSFSLAACGDAATAPASAPAREIAGSNSAAAVAGGGGFPQVATFISVHIVDIAVKPVTEKATVKFRWSQPKDSLTLQDNSAKDLDPTVGVVKIAAPRAGGYEACVRDGTAHFAADTAGKSYPTCNSKSWLSYNFDLGFVYMRRKPQLTVRMIDEWSHLLPGAGLHIYNTNAWSLNVLDGQVPVDEPSVNDGKITVTLPKPSLYVWGQNKLPTGKWELIDSQWYQQQINWEDKVNATLVFRQVAF